MHDKHFKPVLVVNLASAVTHHASIIDFAMLCGYEANLNGICYGIGVMASQAQLSGSGEFARFNRRLALMPAIACLIEEDLMKQWSIVCKNPESFITKENIVQQKKMLVNHHIDKADKKSSNFSDLMNALSNESQTGVAEQALYTATIQSGGPWFSVTGTIFKSVPHDEKICDETAHKIRERIRVMIEIIDAKIDGIATNEQMTKCDKKIFDQWNLQKDALKDLQELKDDEIIDLIRETPAFLEGAYAYASSDSYAAKLKKYILCQAARIKIPFNELITNAIGEVIDNVNTSQNWELVQHFHASDKVMTKGGMRKGFKYIDKFAKEKLTDFFDEYQKALGESVELCAFNMSDISHAISGGFDPRRGGSGQYWLIDANQLPVRYFNTADEFSAAIMGCFQYNSHHKNSIVLTIEAVHSNEENKNKNFVKKLNQFKSGFLLNLSEQRQVYLKQDGYDYASVELFQLIYNEFCKNPKYDDITTRVAKILRIKYDEKKATIYARWLKIKFGDEIKEVSNDTYILFEKIELILSDFNQYKVDASIKNTTITHDEFQEACRLLRGIVSSWEIQENFFISMSEQLKSVFVYSPGEDALLELSDTYRDEGGDMEEKPGKVKRLLNDEVTLIVLDYKYRGLDIEAAINALSLEQEKILANIAREQLVNLQLYKFQLNKSILEEAVSSETILSDEHKENISICIAQARHLATQIGNELRTNPAQKSFLIECLIKTNELLYYPSPEALKAYQDFACEFVNSSSPTKKVIAELMIALDVVAIAALDIFSHMHTLGLCTPANAGLIAGGVTLSVAGVGFWKDSKNLSDTKGDVAEAAALALYQKNVS